jgi:sporulation protein YqfC
MKHKNTNIIMFWREIYMADKLKLRKHIADIFDLPSEIILDMPIIKIIANNEVTIENHKGILEYTPCVLRMKSMLGVIKITGCYIQIK